VFTMMKNKGKRLVVLLIAACMILSMFSGMTVSAATDAEIYATTNTIKKVDEKYYYVDASGKTDKKTGWKKVAGKYTYYVGPKGNVTVKITKGKYYKWSDGQFKKQPVKKNSTKIISGKAFYVNAKGKIDKKTDWKKVSGKYTCYVDKSGAVSIKITSGNYYKWSKKNWKKQSLKKYKNDRIKIKGKYFYVNKNGSMVKTAKTVKYGNYKFVIKSDGTCIKTKVNASNDPIQKETTSGKKETAPHVCQWLQITDENGAGIETNRVDHPKKSHIETQMLRDAWDEPIYAARKWLVCNTCSGELGIDDQDCAYENTAELDKHQDAVHHGGNHLVKKIIDYKHHNAVYADVSVTKERAYEEWDETYKCTVCGDTMTVHVVCGDTEQRSGTCAYIPNKSGDLVWDDGTLRRTVKAGVPYGVYVDDSYDTAYLTLLKDHGIVK